MKMQAKLAITLVSLFLAAAGAQAQKEGMGKKEEPAQNKTKGNAKHTV